MLAQPPLHVSLPYNAARLRDQRDRRRRLRPPRRGVELHWDDPSLGERGDATAVGLRDALVRVILDESRETAIAALDWALHTGRIDLLDAEAIMLRVTTGKRIATDWLDPRCESLPESLSRTRLREAGHQLVSQVVLETGEPIDLVVDGVVGLEVDGDRYHRDRFERDRRKDAQIILENMHPFRPSARMVFHEWPVVLAAVEAAIASRTPPVSVGNSGLRLQHPRRKRLRDPASPSAPEFPTQPPAGMGREAATLGTG